MLTFAHVIVNRDVALTLFFRATLLIPQTISEISAQPQSLDYSSRVIFSGFNLISQEETSEAFIGEWAEKRGIRDQLVIATKVLLNCSSIVLVNVEIWLTGSIRLASSEAKMISPTRLTMQATTPNLFICP